MTKVILSTTKLLLSDKITFVRQKLILSDKSNFVIDKSTFVGQKLLLSTKVILSQTKLLLSRQNYFCRDKITFVLHLARPLAKGYIQNSVLVPCIGYRWRVRPPIDWLKHSPTRAHAFNTPCTIVGLVRTNTGRVCYCLRGGGGTCVFRGVHTLVIKI